MAVTVTRYGAQYDENGTQVQVSKARDLRHGDVMVVEGTRGRYYLPGGKKQGTFVTRRADGVIESFTGNFVIAEEKIEVDVSLTCKYNDNSDLMSEAELDLANFLRESKSPLEVQVIRSTPQIYSFFLREVGI